MALKLLVILMIFYCLKFQNPIMVVYSQSKVINFMASEKEVTEIIIMLPVYLFSILKHVFASTKVKLARYNCFAISPDFWEYI